MSFIKILKNQTASPINIKDTGITLPASPDTYIIPEQEYEHWMASVDITAPVTSGDIVVNDGTSDLSATLGLDLLKTAQDGSYWNAVKLKGVEIDDSAKADGKILKYDSVSGKLKYANDETAATTFGQDYDKNESTGTNSTSSTVYQNKINHTFTGLTDGGEYMVTVYTEARFEEGEDGIQLRLRLANGTITDPDFKLGDKQDDEWFSWKAVGTKTLNGTTSLNVKVQYRSGDIESLVSIRRTRVYIWRVS